VVAYSVQLGQSSTNHSGYTSRLCSAYNQGSPHLFDPQLTLLIFDSFIHSGKYLLDFSLQNILHWTMDSLSALPPIASLHLASKQETSQDNRTTMSPPSVFTSPAQHSMASSFQSPQESIATTVDDNCDAGASDIMIPEAASNVRLFQDITPPPSDSGHRKDLQLPPLRNTSPAYAPIEKPVLPGINQLWVVERNSPDTYLFKTNPNQQNRTSRQEYNRLAGVYDAPAPRRASTSSLRNIHETRRLPAPNGIEVTPSAGFGGINSRTSRYGRSILPPTAQGYTGYPEQAQATTPTTSRRYTNGGSSNQTRPRAHTTSNASPASGHKRKASNMEGGSSNGEEKVARRRNTNPNRPAKPQKYSDILGTHEHFLPPMDPEAACATYRPAALHHRMQVIDPPPVNRSDLSQDPHRLLIHPWEVELAEDLRFQNINQYYINKLRVFKRLWERRREGRGFTKTHAQAAGTVDVNKMSRLWEIYNRVGWFDAPFQKEIDERLERLPAAEAAAAKEVVF
jgi:hypothetical protein